MTDIVWQDALLFEDITGFGHCQLGRGVTMPNTLTLRAGRGRGNPLSYVRSGGKCQREEIVISVINAHNVGSDTSCRFYKLVQR